MARKFVVREGDNFLFSASFGNAILLGNLVKSIQSTIPHEVKIKNKKVCVIEDAITVTIPGIAYTSPPSTIPGSGVVKIKMPLSNEFTFNELEIKGKKVFIYEVGAQIPSEFLVTVPAQTPGTPPVPDTTPRYSGTCTILNVQQKVYKKGG